MTTVLKYYKGRTKDNVTITTLVNDGKFSSYDPSWADTTNTTIVIADESAIDTAIGISAKRSRQKRIYDPIVISPPKDPISLGKTVRCVDRFNGLDISADITSYSMAVNAYNLNGSGVHEMTVTIEEPFSVIS